MTAARKPASAAIATGIAQAWLLPLVFVAGFATALVWMMLSRDPTPEAPAAAAALPRSQPLSERLAELANSNADPAVVAALVSLEQQLGQQQQRQQQLAKQLASLAGNTATPVDASLLVTGAEPDQLPADDQATDTAAPPGRRGNSVDPVLRRQRMLQAGAAAGEADAILDLVDDIALSQAELRYRADREGWLRSRRYYEERRALPDAGSQVRQEYGEDAYDRYLYATGQPNRVQVRNVLRNSPAEQSGIKSGDTVLAVDGQRVYSMRDISKISAAGQDGELIAVDVQRDGNRVALYLPRGPLGIQGDQQVVQPGATPPPG